MQKVSNELSIAGGASSMATIERVDNVFDKDFRKNRKLSTKKEIKFEFDVTK